MQIRIQRADTAFSLMEVMITASILGVMFISMYAGLSSGFAAVNLARENLRATQVLTEKMEEFRTYSWSELSNGATNIPRAFIAYFFPTNVAGSTNIDVANSGIIYTGAVSIATAGFSESYNSDLKLITIDVTWRSAGNNRNRSMQTLVSQYGMRNYLY